MIANYASSVDTRKWAAKKIAGDEEEMGTWEKVVFGVVFFFTTMAQCWRLALLQRRRLATLPTLMTGQVTIHGPKGSNNNHNTTSNQFRQKNDDDI